MGRQLFALLAALALLAGCAGTDTAVERAQDDAASDTAPPATEPPTTTAATPPSTTAAPTTTAPPAGLAAPAPAGSPEELASRVVAAETVARAPDTDEDALATAAFELQVLYRQLGRTPEWDLPVADAVPASLRNSVVANAAARREFRGMHSNLSDTLPAWRIVEPPPAEELLAHYQEGEATFGVPWEILAAVNLVETGMGRIRGTSVAGAQGPMQFLPATWAAFGAGGDIDDPHDAILGAARYLAHNGGGSGDVANALWNYNHSERYVRGVQLYASVMEEDPAAYRAFHQWQIVYLSTAGEIWMPTGYEELERLPVVDYVAREPDHLLTTATT